jgi:hypothetical protein
MDTTIPATLNGSKIRHARHRYAPGTFTRSGGLVVLVEHHGCQPWVTAVWSPAMGGGWEWGHYFATEAEARTDFWTR